MPKILAGVLMLAFVVGLSTVSSPPTQAQDKTKTKDKAKSAVKGGIIEIAAGKDDKFRFFVRDADGKLLAMSGPGGFATEEDAHAAIDHLKAVVSSAKVTTKKAAAVDKSEK
jgi:uncharacterized protein YegP (UPF0339 family)